jgi:hypothetical protein
MTNRDITARLRKCLALANDHRASEHERAAARRAADELMRRHNLTAHDVWQGNRAQVLKEIDEENSRRWRAEQEVKRKQWEEARKRSQEREARAKARREEKARRSAAWQTRRKAAAERRAQKEAALRARLGPEGYRQRAATQAGRELLRIARQRAQQIKRRQRDLEQQLEQLRQDMHTIFAMADKTAEDREARLQMRWKFNKNLATFVTSVRRSRW